AAVERLCGSGQMDDEGSAFPARRPHFDPAAVRRNDLVHDVQTQAEMSPVPALNFLRAVEQTVDPSRLDRRTLIVDRESHLVSTAGRGDHDGLVGCTVVYRVADEIDQRLHESLGVPTASKISGHPELESIRWIGR